MGWVRINRVGHAVCGGEELQAADGAGVMLGALGAWHTPAPTHSRGTAHSAALPSP